MAGGDVRLKRPSTSPRTLAFRSTDPPSPKPSAGFPRSASTASRRSPAPLNSRGAVSRSPGQYATPRLLTAAGAVYLQITLAVSGSSARMSRPAVTYIRPPTTSGVTWMPLAPVSKQPGCDRAETQRHEHAPDGDSDQFSQGHAGLCDRC